MKEVPLTKGYIALVDDEDYERVSQWKWYAKESKSSNGQITNVYAKRRKWKGRKKPNGDLESLHRFVMRVSDPTIEIDHQNGSGLDCQKHNLRIATSAQNKRNTGKRILANGTSRYKGVGWWKYDKIQWGGYWRTRIQLGDKQITRNFHSELRAAVEYDWLALNQHGEFARTNFQLCPLITDEREVVH